MASTVLSSLGIPQATLRVATAIGNIIFLHPSEFPTLAPSAPDPFIYGTATLTLPKAREIRSLSVKLVGVYDIRFPNGHAESSEFILTEMKIQTGLPTLGKGEHSYAFKLSVPMDSAPGERTIYGSVQYLLVAEATGPGFSIKGDKEFDITVHPGEEGVPLYLNMDTQRFNEDVGPYNINVSSQHFTVAGLFDFNANFPSIPDILYIHKIAVKIVQTTKLFSLVDPTLQVTTPRQEIPLFTLTALNPPDSASQPLGKFGNTNILAKVQAGEALKVGHSIRLPFATTLRATTHPGTIRCTPFRSSHELHVNIMFQREGQKVKILKVVRPISIPSCCCTLESTLVPSYAAADPLPCKTLALLEKLECIPMHKRKLCQMMTCACGQTFEVLVKQAEEGKAARGEVGEYVGADLTSVNTGSSDGSVAKKYEYNPPPSAA